jgi:hypothetical protein
MPVITKPVPHVVAGYYTNWLLKVWTATYLLAPVVYSVFWWHSEGYTNAYGFWGAGYPILLFLFNLVLGLPMLYLGILLLHWVCNRLEPGNFDILLFLLTLLTGLLIGQMLVKSWLFSMPFFRLFVDAAGPTFASALLCTLLKWRSLTGKLNL